jgi:CheY-like chemotaxis protein
VSEPAEASREWPWAKRAPEPEAELEPSVEPVTEVPLDATAAEGEPLLEPAPVESEAVAEPPAEAARATGGAGVMVIIEDDKVAADYYATLFRGNGYQVDIANDGVSGVDLCVRLQPQVILLDVMMPRQNGILVLQTLRASDETRNTPVVVMSNFSEPTLIKRALQLGALEYVIKTQVEGPALLNAVPHWMNREKAFAA